MNDRAAEPFRASSPTRGRRVKQLLRIGLKSVAAGPIRRAMKIPLLRKLMEFAYLRVPGLNRVLLRFLVGIGYLPAIVAEMAATKRLGLLQGGKDFTQKHPPGPTLRAAYIAERLRAPSTTGSERTRSVDAEGPTG